MKVTCKREELAHAFATAATVVNARSPKAILRNVKFDVVPDEATLSATDLEIGLRMSVPGVTVESPGSVVLPVASFGPILRESSDETLEIEYDGTAIHVRGQQSRFRLASEDPNEFPAIRGFEEDRYHEISARFFRELVRRTVFATDNESGRYALGGVLIELEGDGIVGVATDGRRLSMQTGPATAVGEHSTADTTTIIPTRAMNLIDRATAGNDEAIQIAVRDNDVLVRSERTTIYSRLVEGRFPRWRDVFPRRDDASTIELPVGPFFAAVRQAGILASGENRGVEFTFETGKVVLEGVGAEVGESRVELPIEYDGPTRPIRLDHRFVSDFLRVLEPDCIFSFEVQSPDGPAICKYDNSFSYVIMPLAREQ